MRIRIARQTARGFFELHSRAVAFLRRGRGRVLTARQPFQGGISARQRQVAERPVVPAA